jgi:hypothetical protein
MSMDVVSAIDRRINQLEGQLGALRTARRVLVANSAGLSRKPKRRLTEAEKAAISRRMKATWKKRKAAAKGN